MADMPKGNFPCLFLYKDEVEGGNVSTKIEIILRSLVKVVSTRYKIQEIYERAVQYEMPDQYKTHEMCNEVVKKCLCSLIYVPHDYRTQEVYERVVERNPYFLMLLPNRFMTQDMCRGAMKKCPWTLIYVPNWLVAPDMLENLDNYEGLNEFGEWYDDYKKHKAKKHK